MNKTNTQESSGVTSASSLTSSLPSMTSSCCSVSSLRCPGAAGPLRQDAPSYLLFENAELVNAPGLRLGRRRVRVTSQVWIVDLGGSCFDSLWALHSRRWSQAIAKWLCLRRSPISSLCWQHHAIWAPRTATIRWSDMSTDVDWMESM